MRTTIDIILLFIGTSTLTDEEFEALTLTEPYTQYELYTQIYTVLLSRGEPQEILDRLWYYFKAQGETFTQTNTPQSNILIGAVCDPS